MKDIDLKTLLPQAEEIARQAGAEIMKFYAGTTVYIKNDGSEVTDADHAAENLILPALKKLTPDIPIVSEERVAAGEVPDVSGGTFWTVDPLDGTKEFINKTGAFVVAIGLVVDGHPVMGIIYHPVTGLMYSGMGPGTASKIGADGIRKPVVAGPKVAAEDLHVLVNEPHADMPRIKGYLSSQFKKAAKIDPKSGIFRACQVAEGLADMVIVCSAKRQGRNKWWDVAPGHAIVEAAGGKVEGLDGLPLIYNAADLQVPPHVIMAANHDAKPSAQKKPPGIS
jgi:3'(2'), 5'-bisphosphate nucleotidase